MDRICFFCQVLFLLTSLEGICQNLIPNSGFEELITVPLSNAFDAAYPWKGPSVDLYGPRPDSGFRFEPFKLESGAIEGDHYMGLNLYSNVNKEYALVPLTTSPKNGNRYLLSFYYQFFSTGKIKNFEGSLKFFDNKNTIDLINPDNLDYSIRLTFDSPKKSKRWEFFEKSFVANGDEVFFQISYDGVCKKNKLAYFFFDKFSLKCLDCERGQTLSVPLAENTPSYEQTLVEDQIYMLYFKTNDYVLSKGQVDSLNQIASLLNNGNFKVLISGHSDSSGNERYNVELSRKRAIAVKNELLKSGLVDSRVDCEWFGCSNPILSSSAIQDCSMCRRVEIKILGKQK
ncbi:MAG: hypothetical protein RIQ89_1030 [Bacteroidota bacterium]